MKQLVIILSLAIISFSAIKSAQAETKTALFAGGCFWCIESDFDKVPGVLTTISGYTGGDLEEATYKAVSNGGTGHYEALKITYDSEQVSYDELLHVFWRHIDPFDAQGQFCDKGLQYRAGIFVADDQEEKQAIASKEATEALLGQRIVTEVLPATKFYAAENYHQDYHTKNPGRYNFYRWKCGRDQRVKDVWKNVTE